MLQTDTDLRYREKLSIHAPTVMYLSREVPLKKIAKMYGCPQTVIDRIISGRALLYGEEKDEKVLKALGLKLCECCELRLVPIATVRVQKCDVDLRKMCQICYRFGEAGTIIDHSLNLDRR